MSTPVKINPDRLWQSLMTMAEIGATDLGGCNRQALTELDKEGRDLFVNWCHEAGCVTEFDAMGNLFARRPGTKPDAGVVMAGSHLDTQPTGGRFDGVYGVLSALEVVRTLNDHNIETEHPIEIVSWTNEEGARFSPAMVGSGVWSGEFDLDYGLTRMDKEGVTLGQALEGIGYAGHRPTEPGDIKAAFELHIEQGPILENEKTQIGIVSGVQGMNWYDLKLIGSPVHAGPTPMDSRQDPMMALGSVVNRLYALAEDHAPLSRVTFGDISAEPGARNTVPASVTVSLDMRHPDQAILDEMDSTMRSILAEESERFGLEHEVHDEWRSPAVVFDRNCVAAIEQAVDVLELKAKSMFSGAGHDSVYVSRVAPTAMIFVPCEKGISHNEAENMTADDAAAGCDVLLHAILDRAS